MGPFDLHYARSMNNLGATERHASTSKNWNFFFLPGNQGIHACVPGPFCESEHTEGNEQRSNLAMGSRQFQMGRSRERSSTWPKEYFCWRSVLERSKACDAEENSGLGCSRTNGRVSGEFFGVWRPKRYDASNQGSHLSVNGQRANQHNNRIHRASHTIQCIQ